MRNEEGDKKLFDDISKEYSRKDIFPVSRLARQFQLFSLTDLIGRDHYGHILDIGCGPGFNADYLAGKYHQYTGVDYSERFIEIARSLQGKGNFITANVKSLDQVCNDHYDIILGCGILHHIDELDKALSSIRRICSRDTVLAFVEPYKGNPVVQLMRYIRKKTDRSYSDEQVFFSRKELRSAFSRNGFRIGRFRYQGYFSTPFAQVILRPVKLFLPLCKFAVKSDLFIQKYLNNPLSWNITFTAMMDHE